MNKLLDQLSAIKRNIHFKWKLWNKEVFVNKEIFPAYTMLVASAKIILVRFITVQLMLSLKKQEIFVYNDIIQAETCSYNCILSFKHFSHAQYISKLR